MRLSVIIVNWNERDDLDRCLHSLMEDRFDGAIEVLVVDNGSSDGSPELVRRRYESVQLLVNSKNRGLTVARNQGLRRARGRYVAMLDSDTEVRSGSLQTLCDLLDTSPEVGLVGPKLVYRDGTLQHSCRRVPEPLALVANRLTSLRFMREHPARRRYLMLDDPHDRVTDVEYVLGAAMVFRRGAAAAIGPFDERFGFSMPGGYGFDDADWCIRIRRAGFRVVYCPAALVVHGYRRRTVGRPFSRQSLGLALSYAALRLKHRRAYPPSVG